MKRLFSFTNFMLAMMVFACSAGSYAESIGGISLNSGIKAIKAKYGKPAEVKNLDKNRTAYLWEIKDNSLKIIVDINKIVLIQASADITSKGKTKTFSTLKGVYPGASGKSIEKLYGKGRDDYAYQSEDCFVVNYKINDREQLIFRIYGFSDRGAIVIDTILCKPGYPKDKIWKE
ncbi:MAG: hypothetical protein LWY06_18735 [Firmicutes bacterium]|nr:hypothetical protein [Bacillota bacterium]